MKAHIRKLVNELKRECRKYGATVTECEDLLVKWYADTPAGVVWAATETHDMCFGEVMPDDVARQEKVLRAMIEDVRKGVKPCEVEDCDDCLEKSEGGDGMR